MPRRLEPVEHDPFIGDPFLHRDPALQELDRRRSDGIDVRLLWGPTDDRVVVAVSYARTRDAFEFTVEPREARDGSITHTRTPRRAESRTAFPDPAPSPRLWGRAPRSSRQ